jgi:hypothetical protein
LLCLHAYLNKEQVDRLPAKFEIEHILPKKWQNANYRDWTIESAAEHLEKYGNKVAFEKRLNIQAGNDYFGKKKDKYRDSAIAEARELLLHESNDWTPSDIIKREEKFFADIMGFIKSNIIIK